MNIKGLAIALLVTALVACTPVVGGIITIGGSGGTSSGSQPSSSPTIGTWTYAASEWQTFTMPYDGVASFKDAHPLSDRTEITASAGQSVPCISTGNGGPFATPGIIYLFRFVCEIHPANVIVPAPTVSLTMTQQPGMPLIDPTIIPAPNTLNTTAILVRPADPGPQTYTDGAFRNGCTWSHFNFDDSIVYPNQPGAAHLHSYCGNASADAFSTDATLLLGASTSTGGAANLSAYWVPAMLKPDPENEGYYLPMIPTGSNNYYKTGFGNDPFEDLVMLPEGIKIVAGNSPSNADEASVPPNWDFYCSYDNNTQKYIPPCPEGYEIVQRGNFPNCWDGVNLDSPNHRSHMAIQDETGHCPSSHPVNTVVLGINWHYHIGPGDDPTTWKLSCDTGMGGLCSHADVRVHWSMLNGRSIAEDWMDGCVRGLGSCQGNTNMGYELYDVGL